MIFLDDGLLSTTVSERTAVVNSDSQQTTFSAVVFGLCLDLCKKTVLFDEAGRISD